MLVIGLDSATFELLKPWVDKGLLPTLSTLLYHGANGELRSTVPPHTAPAWSSFMTGKNPGKHGVFGFMKLTEDHEQLRLVSSLDRKAEDLWELLGRQGKKVIVLRVPVSYPVRPVNGILVSGFMTPPSAADYVYPPSMKDEIEAEIGPLSVKVSNSPVKMDLEQAILNDLNSALDRLEHGLPRLVGRADWDFFMIVFQGTDEVQHRFWHLVDHTHPRYDPEKAAKYGDAIPQYYQRVDTIIASMLSQINRENTVVVTLSDHGARALHKWVSINNIFWRCELLAFKRDLITQLKLLAFKIGLTPITLYRAILRLHLTSVRNLVRQEETRSNLRPFFVSLRDVDWQRAQAYALGGWGQIYVNRDAVVSDRYEDIRREIVDALLDARDSANGAPIFRRDSIFFREDVYEGHYLQQAPDIIALPDPPYQGYPDYEFGFNNVVSDGVGISGTHAMDGILVLSGPNIRQGRVLRNIAIVDVAPTILYLMGLAVPSDFDGAVITEAITESYLAAHPLLRTSAHGKEIDDTNPYTRDEEEKLQRKLKDLGYL